MKSLVPLFCSCGLVLAGFLGAGAIHAQPASNGSPGTATPSPYPQVQPRSVPAPVNHPPLLPGSRDARPPAHPPRDQPLPLLEQQRQRADQDKGREAAKSPAPPQDRHE
ncbi:MAG: hypothetical protein V4812_13425 [Pseudomonadota bacterium]